MKLVMLSHASRTESRTKSLASLARATALPVTVIESTYTGPTPDAEVRARGYDALMAASGRDMVFLEDDIEVHPDLFRRHLLMAAAAGVVTVFCAVNARHYPPGILDEVTLDAELLPLPNFDADRGYHGSMAVFIPQAVVEHGLNRRHEFQRPDGSPLTQPVIEPDRLRGKVTGFDFWLKHTARAFGGMLVAVPNSVNHVSRHGTWPSLTYHVPERDFLETIC